jgi:hypothetical protein
LEVITQADAAIVLWSKHSVRSQWVVGEASAARDKGILVPVTLDGAELPLDFRTLHCIDLGRWSSEDGLPDALVQTLAHRLGREVRAIPREGRPAPLAGLARRATQMRYEDVESLFFYFIAQAFAVSLTNAPLAAYATRIPLWVSLVVSLAIGVIVTGIQMREVLRTFRLRIAAPVFAAAVLVSPLGLFIDSWLLAKAGNEVFLTLVGFWALALLLTTALARREARREI